MRIVKNKLMYEVGDVVRIVSGDRIPKDSHVGTVHGMYRCCNESFKIKEVRERPWGFAYELEGAPYMWENLFFESDFFVSEDSDEDLSDSEIDEFIKAFSSNHK